MVVRTHGYAGKILRVNLSTGKISTEPTMKYAKRFIGGEGINQWILFNDVFPGIWPLDPANEIIIGTGVLTGTAVPTAGRFYVASKNVLTGGVGSSCLGGHFGPELKFAGYDHIVIRGRSSKPCYIDVNDGDVKVRDAGHLWGKTTRETEDMIREEHGDRDIQLLTIGPAGENLVRGANIMGSGGHSASRCGLGAVMGSKNLKAVAVRGSGGISIAKSDEFMQLAEMLSKRIKTAPLFHKLRQGGTFSSLEAFNYLGNIVVRNFQDVTWDPEKVRKTEIKKEYHVRDLACFACPVACKKYLRITDGLYRGVEGQSFDLGVASSLMTKLDIDCLPAVIKMAKMCNQLGLDADNTGGPIAWAMECYEKGILTERDTGGLKLKWGDYETVIQLIKMIAYREGFGDLLAEGSWRASQIVGKGSEKYAMHIKGQDLEESLIGKIGYALGVIVACTGGGHLRGAPVCEGSAVSPEVAERFYGVRTAGDRTAYEGKGKLVAWTEIFKAVVDIMGTCVFMSQRNMRQGINMEDYAKLYTAATGFDLTAEELRHIGERVLNLHKAFNVREGFTRKHDYPPERFFKPASSGEHLIRDKLEKSKDEYYASRGWDVETSLPTRQKLEELELPEVAEQLEQLGKKENKATHGDRGKKQSKGKN